MKFTKMHGCGNDYVYVDGAKEQIPAKDKPELVRKLSDRHFGIGGDGVIFIKDGSDVLVGNAEDIREEHGKSIADVYRKIFS